MLHRLVLVAALFVAALFAAAPASADDTWTTPFPGIRYLHRTGTAVSSSGRRVNVNVHGAVVDLCAPGVSVRHTAFEERRRTTSSYGQLVGAQWAINADYSCRPVDVLPGSGATWCHGLAEYMTYGLAAHAGVPWPNAPARDAVLAFGPGRVELYDLGVHQELEPWMQEVLSGHWTLVVDGHVDPLIAGDPTREPRTAIGLSEDRTQLILMVADGRHDYLGMSFAEEAAFLIELGAYSGFNLDGGGSSTMWSSADGVLNHPSDGSERVVGPHLGIFASGSGPAPFCDSPWRVDGTVALPLLVPQGARGRFVPVADARLFDTRDPATALEGMTRDADGRLAAASTLTSDALDGEGGPLGATAAVVRLAVLEAAGGGFASAFAAASPRPISSSVNYAAAEPVANLTITSLDAEGRLSIFASTPAQLVADLSGYFASAGAGFVPEPPARLLDTRSDVPLDAHVPRVVVPPGAAELTAYALGLAAVDAVAPGSLAVYPCDAPLPASATLYYAPGRATSATTLVGAGPGGVCAVADTAVHLIVDRSGRFEASSGLDYQPFAPTRLIDTRQPTGLWYGRIPAGTTAELDLHDAPGFPADAEAVTLVVTAVTPIEGGFAVLHPCDAPRPEISSLNFSPGRTVANTVVVRTDGSPLCAYFTGRTHVVIDLVGAFVPAPPAPDAGPVNTLGTDPASPSSPDAGSADASETTGDAKKRDAMTGSCGCATTSAEGGGPASLACAALALALHRRRRRCTAR